MVLVAYCRAGFEDETAADLRRIAARADGTLDISAQRGDAYVIANGAGFGVGTLQEAVRDTPPIFARSVWCSLGLTALVPAPGPPRPDRVTPLLAAIEGIGGLDPPRWRSVWIEYPDTNDGKALSTLARALASRIEGELHARGHIDPLARQRLHIFLTDGSVAYVGTSVAETNEWPMGIPRLHMPRSAPSRSTLKLAEAFATFLGDDAARLLRPGMRAVDLGAAPGGWTWQLTQRGLKVTAVDNGPLKGAVADDPLVTHLREDGLRWRPRRPVDWLVCDIVEQPIRIAELVAHWIGDGAAKQAIFNLKLPMKKRYAEIAKCRARIDSILSASNESYTLRLKQLYHDREEVTGHLFRNGVG
jgi:23S rRNA (cytidine2498-2'-O)-methyltransferase